MTARIARRLLLAVFGVIWLLPVYLIVVNADRPATGFDQDAVWRPPTSFAIWDNFRSAWDSASFGSSIPSTLLYSVLSPLIALVVGSLAGFGIVVLRLRHGFAWFMFLFGATIFPVQMLLVPLFVSYARTNLYDTQLGMVAIYTAISIPFTAFVMRNFFTGISYSVFEAALIDGATVWRIFWRIYLPMSVTALGAVFILQSTFIWNDLVLGLTLSSSGNIRPVMPALASLQSAYGGSTLPVVLAAGVGMSIPTILLFLAAQRLFVRGLSLGQF